MSLDNFIIVDSCTNQWFAACDTYLLDKRKLSEEDENILCDYPSPKTEEILQKHGMSLEDCEYHKIMEDAMKEESTPKKAVTSLSDATVGKLADALALDAVVYIRESEEYVQFMTEHLTKFLNDKMGQMDENLSVEIISELITEKIFLTP